MARHIVYYQVQYFHPHKKEWLSILNYHYDNLADAEKKADECKRGFGETRVVKRQCYATGKEI